MATRRKLLGGGLATITSAAVLRPATASADVSGPASTNPDADLIKLGRQLAAEWHRIDDFCANDPDKSDEGLDAVMEPAHDIVDRIEHMQAHTFEGVKVKALAISWCKGGREIDPDTFAPYSGATTDARLAASIVRDLLRSQ